MLLIIISWFMPWALLTFFSTRLPSVSLLCAQFMHRFCSFIIGSRKGSTRCFTSRLRTASSPFGRFYPSRSKRNCPHWAVSSWATTLWRPWSGRPIKGPWTRKSCTCHPSAKRRHRTPTSTAGNSRGCSWTWTRWQSSYACVSSSLRPGWSSRPPRGSFV